MTQENESTQKKLAWQCRRGMLELDVILIPFLERFYPSLDAAQQGEFARLLEAPDPDLYTWIMGYGHAEDHKLQQIVEKIREKMEIA